MHTLLRGASFFSAEGFLIWDICRSEESAMKDSSALETKIVIDKVTNRNSNNWYESSKQVS